MRLRFGTSFPTDPSLARASLGEERKKGDRKKERRGPRSAKQIMAIAKRDAQSWHTKLQAQMGPRGTAAPATAVRYSGVARVSCAHHGGMYVCEVSVGGKRYAVETIRDVELPKLIPASAGAFDEAARITLAAALGIGQVKPGEVETANGRPVVTRSRGNKGRA